MKKYIACDGYGLHIIEILYDINDKIKLYDTTTKKRSISKIRYDEKQESYFNHYRQKYYLNEFTKEFV